MRAGRRRTNNDEQTREAASSLRSRKLKLQGVLQILSNGNNVQTTAVHRHAHVLGTEDSLVHEVDGVFQRRAHIIELLSAVNVQRVRHVLEHHNLWALFVDVI